MKSNLNITSLNDINPTEAYLITDLDVHGNVKSAQTGSGQEVLEYVENKYSFSDESFESKSELYSWIDELNKEESDHYIIVKLL